MNYLLVSAGTLLFYICIIPLADGITNYLNNLLGVANAKLQAKVNEILPPEQEPCSTNVVGFQIPPQEEYEEDEL